ncbi:hypothetical protein CAG61_08395 [Vibrio sp. V34_P3A8T189]|uniref:hypothetical protein n=1 Tax=unclassified Vibrio TaxID=2614977 RepID=UPI0013735120|nr:MULTISPECIES: hypothetical protein [unclassified Vibrio]NAW78348.1 hypothetical protein [Vibrio sp. V33_P6A3T137]NAX01873.1 hypothetical protein [Vibrio sp. V34_P3A8T189]NAX08248.1 hypothetical protein [Vibrio sp. V40_P2S30T141]
MNSLTETNLISPEQLPSLQKKLVRKVNREAASLLAVEALAKQITELSHGRMNPQKLDQIQQYAEAIMYNLEDARERMTSIALGLNELSIKEQSHV